MMRGSSRALRYDRMSPSFSQVSEDVVHNLRVPSGEHNNEPRRHHRSSVKALSYTGGYLTRLLLDRTPVSSIMNFSSSRHPRATTLPTLISQRFKRKTTPLITMYDISAPARANVAAPVLRVCYTSFFSFGRGLSCSHTRSDEPQRKQREQGVSFVAIPLRRKHGQPPEPFDAAAVPEEAGDLTT